MADIEVSYKNAVIKSQTGSGTVTLHTEGKYMEDDVDIVYVAPAGGGPQGDYLQIYAEEVTIGANSVTNTSVLNTYLLGLLSNPGAICAISPQTGLTVANNAIGSMYYTVGQSNMRARRYRNGSWGYVYWNNASYDAKVTAGDKYVVWTMVTGSDPT